MIKIIAGVFAFFWMYICVFGAVQDNLSISIIAAMFANIFYVTFLFMEDGDDDDYYGLF